MNAPLPYMLMDRINELPTKDWLIEEIVGRGEVIALVAESFTGKSLAASHLSLCIATGKAWFGRRVHAGPVIYVAGERARVTIRRLLGAKHYLGLGELPIAVVTQSPNLAREGEIEQLLKSIRDIEQEINKKAVLIIFDTLARAMVGLDENSARDAGLVAKGLDKVVAETGATVLLLHHTPKGSKEFRGSSAFVGALDAVLTLRKSNSVRYLKLEQANDAEEGAEFVFRLKEVALDDGREAIVVEPVPPSENFGRGSGASEASLPASDARSHRSATNEHPHLTPDQRAVFDALLKVAGDQNEIRNQDVWRSAAIAALRTKKPRSDQALNQAFNAARKALQDLGFIKIDGATVLIRIRSESGQSSDRRHRNQKSDQNAPPP